MAELDVQPKKSSPWWLWLLLALIALALLFYFLRDKDASPGMTTGNDSAQVSNTMDPNWDSVDFNSPAAAYDEISDKDINVRGTDKYSIYSIGENILFATDQSSIQASGESKLQQVVASLNKRYKGATIGVYGRTDSTGTASHNKELGAERAEAVKNWLVKNGNIDESKVTTHSLGQSNPVASNETAEGRQENRSVEIVVFGERNQ